MYDPIAEINTLRMNGYVVTSGLGCFIVNQKFILNPSKKSIYDGVKNQYYRWQPHNLLEKIKSIESPQAVKNFNLIYYIGTRKVETIASNKPRAICQAELNRRKYSENYKSGTLKIEPIQIKK